MIEWKICPVPLLNILGIHGVNEIFHMHDPEIQLPEKQSESELHPPTFCEQVEPRHSSPNPQSESKSHADIFFEHEPSVHCSNLPQSESNLH